VILACEKEWEERVVMVAFVISLLAQWIWGFRSVRGLCFVAVRPAN